MSVSRHTRTATIARLVAWSSLLLGAAACSLRPYEFAGGTTDAASTSTTSPIAGDTSTTSSSTTIDVTGSTTAAPTSSTGATTTSTSDGGFITPPDGGGPTNECDLWTDDCPEGQKCMPFSGDGDNSWESYGCFDLVRDPAGVGEPCVVFGSGVSGEDDCEAGSMCWNVDWDTGKGTCVGFCEGSPDMPVCPDPGTTCTGGRVLLLCLPMCDPLAQDCANGDLCIPNPNDPANWLCVLDASGEEGQVFDPCEYANACDPGFLCQDPTFASECDQGAIGCCLPFCNIDVPDSCPGAGQTCIPWYEEGQAPPPFAHVGLCGLPQP